MTANTPASRKAKGRKAIKPKKPKPEKVDGLGPIDIKKIRSAIRLVWHRSHARRLVVARCLNPNGFSVCEKCSAVVAKVYVDHIEPVGELDVGFIRRLFTPSKNLQGLCRDCHNEKTRKERKLS